MKRAKNDMRWVVEGMWIVVLVVMQGTSVGGQCPAPVTTAPLHGTVGSCNATVPQGEYCDITCLIGFTLHGPSYYCEYGRIYGGPRSCVVAPCNAPVTTSPANGMSGACGTSLDQGTSCSIDCEDGYSVFGEQYTCSQVGSGPSSVITGGPQSCVLSTGVTDTVVTAMVLGCLTFTALASVIVLVYVWPKWCTIPPTEHTPMSSDALKTFTFVTLGWALVSMAPLVTGLALDGWSVVSVSGIPDLLTYGLLYDHINPDIPTPPSNSGCDWHCTMRSTGGMATLITGVLASMFAILPVAAHFCEFTIQSHRHYQWAILALVFSSAEALFWSCMAHIIIVDRTHSPFTLQLGISFWLTIGGVLTLVLLAWLHAHFPQARVSPRVASVADHPIRVRSIEVQGSKREELPSPSNLTGPMAQQGPIAIPNREEC